MKQYELIKKYKDCPPLGSIAKEQASGVYAIDIRIDPLIPHILISSKKGIESYPEYWKLIYEDGEEVIPLTENDIENIVQSAIKNMINNAPV